MSNHLRDALEEIAALYAPPPIAWMERESVVWDIVRRALDEETS